MATMAAAAVAVALSQSAAFAAEGGVTETFADVFGRNATGADVQRKVLAEMDILEKTLEEKRRMGTLTAEEKTIIEHLPEARQKLAQADGSAYDAIARLTSGETIKIDVPDGAGGAVKPLTLSAADIEKAQAEAAKLASSAEEFAASPEGRSITETAQSAAGTSNTGSASGTGAGAAAVFGGPSSVTASLPAGFSAGGVAGAGGDTTIATASGTDNGYYVSVYVGNGEEGPGVLGRSASGSMTNYLDAAPFETFQWVYGGFHGDKAEPREVVIAGAKFKSDGMSFKWIQDLSQWGIAHEDFSQAIACLFVMNKNGEWVGGKFDWISSSRNTRDFKNIYSGYNDWSLMDVPNPCPAAFVVVSKDGRKRSNVIGGMWQR